MAVGRGVVLLLVAFVLGVFLLQRVDAPDAEERVRAGTSDDDTALETTTTTTVARTTTTTAPLRAPKDVKVLSANGTSTKGAAGRVKDKLFTAGYNVLAATDTTSPSQASFVYFVAGFDREAAVVAQVLALAATTVQPMPATPPVADLKGANVVVVVGPDLAAQNPPSSSTTAGTATTAKPTTTTKP